ncbi:fructosamine kinase family protein [Synechococcus sp. W4D4]|uniref:fructosamine kinase family protein n=1 Tax=Synechococcus sp. W4D4 TaxID=3392294 RepID=UPI0039EC2CC3
MPIAACWQRPYLHRVVPSPQAFSDWIEATTGVGLLERSPVGGGCIHSAWCLTLADGRELFAKTNRAALLPVLDAEAQGLEALSSAIKQGESGLLAPQPCGLGLAGTEAVLLLNWLQLGHPADQTGAWGALGAGLARMHRGSLQGHDGRFGWERDNFIGSGPQTNRWGESWGRFFAEERLGAQLRWAAASGKTLHGAEELLERVPLWLEEHHAEPALVHGDLWSGNAALLQDGRGSIFDPAVYRGDREVDLAMARLFGGFPRSFFAGYEQEWPLEKGHQQRVELYNLYHLLNHANLFGGGYWQQSAASITALLREWH